MTEDERLERAAHAQRLLNDGLFIEAFDLVRSGIVQKWEAAPVRDRDGAHELKLMLKLLVDVRTALEQALTDGKIVEFNKKQRLLDRAFGAFTNFR